MKSWIQDGGSVTPEQQALADGLSQILEKHDLPRIDVGESSALADARGMHVAFVHRDEPESTIEVESTSGDEILVLYGQEEDSFRPTDAVRGRVWPFQRADHVQTAVAFIEYLLTGRIELHVWKRPLAVKTRSYWIDDRGKPELFSRATTVGPVIGWSKRPIVHRFDFT